MTWVCYKNSTVYICRKLENSVVCLMKLPSYDNADERYADWLRAFWLVRNCWSGGQLVFWLGILFTTGKLSAQWFAECILWGTQQTTYLSSVKNKTLRKKKHSAKYPICWVQDKIHSAKKLYLTNKYTWQKINTCPPNIKPNNGRQNFGECPLVALGTVKSLSGVFYYTRQKHWDFAECQAITALGKASVTVTWPPFPLLFFVKSQLSSRQSLCRMPKK